MKKLIQFSLFLVFSLCLVVFSVNVNSNKLESFKKDEQSIQSQITTEEADKIIKEIAVSMLTPHLQKSFLQAVESVNYGPENFLGFPATCFAPDTDQAAIDAFYEERTALANSLGISDFRFNIGNRWGTTATNGGGLGQGDLTTLTWSYVADGTPIGNGGCGVPGESGNSNFIAFFNGIYGGPTTPGDYTTAPWHNVFVGMFNSWTNASGLIFVYEPNDDGATVVSGGPGITGIRGDFRISGRALDGNSNVLACNYFPNNGDMIIDTSDNFFANNPGVGTTNVLTHEIGHGLGIQHVCPIEQTKLMEPFVTVAFNGPQEDDVLATNRHYGDPNSGNDTPALATFLGISNTSVSYSISQSSIDDTSDVDYFSFTTGTSTVLSGTLMPTGSTYLSGVQNANGSCSAGTNFNALTVSDLRFEVLDTDGTTILATADINGPGANETLTNINLPAPGTYYIRVRQQGAAVNNVQMYNLDFSLVAPPAFNNDVAVTAILEPTELETGLTNAEQLQITITNFGALDQTGIPYEVEINGAIVATETYAPMLASASSVNVTVPTPVDLAAFTTYNICVRTLLPSDENTANNETCKTTLHLNCIPTTTLGCNQDGIKQFVLGTINVDDGAQGCNTDPGMPAGYSNRTDLITDLDSNLGFNVHTLQASTQWGGNERIKVWIDFNENGLFTDAGEEVLNEPFTVAIGNLESFTITIPPGTTLGTKLLRARAFDAAEDPINTGPCDDINYGETQDYTVNIIDSSIACTGATSTWNGTAWSPAAPTNIDIAIINGNYDTGTNGVIEACELNISDNQTLTVEAGDYIRVQNNIFVDGTLLVAHTANVVQVEANAVVVKNAGTGAVINVEITTPVLQQRDFMVMGSPMDTESRNGVFNSAFLVLDHTPNNFNPNTHPNIPQGATNFSDLEGDFWNAYTGTINVGEGYIIRPQMGYGDPANVAYDMTYAQGTLTNGTVIKSTIYDATNSPAGTPNMYANPYPSAIDANQFIQDNGLNALYFWEHLTPPSVIVPGEGLKFDMDDVSIRNFGGGVAANNDNPANIPNGVISTAQGFAIKATANGSVSFTNSMRLTTGNTTLRNNEDQIDRLWLRVESDAYELANNLMIGFNPQATAGMDTGYDTDRLACSVSIYSHLESGAQRLAIQTREAFSDAIKIPVGFSTLVEEETSYTISLSNFEGANLADRSIYIYDNILNILTDLTQEDYTFSSNKSNQDLRFTVVFEHDEEVLGNNAPSLENIALYPNPTNGILNIISTSVQLKEIKVYDVLGREIIYKNLNNVQGYQLDMSALKSAVYFVAITTPQGSILKRIVKK